jgi:hypothetical protein
LTLRYTDRFANGTLSLHRRSRNLGVFFLAEHSSGHRIDQVNTFADRARHDLIGTIVFCTLGGRTIESGFSVAANALASPISPQWATGGTARRVVSRSCALGSNGE